MNVFELVAGVQFVRERVDVVTDENPEIPSKVEATFAGVDVDVHVPLHNPSTVWVADVPVAVKVVDSPFAVITFWADRRGKESVDVTVPVCVDVDAALPPPPPPQAVNRIANENPQPSLVSKFIDHPCNSIFSEPSFSNTVFTVAIVHTDYECYG